MKNLYTSPSGSKYMILEIPEVNVIQTLGVYTGSVITKKAVYKFGGPVLLDINGREVAIGKGVATKIIVESYEV